MSENPREGQDASPPGIWVMTDAGLVQQHYLPGCSPAETEGSMRAEVHRFAVLLRGMLRHYTMTREEVQQALALVYREAGRR